MDDDVLGLGWDKARLRIIPGDEWPIQAIAVAEQAKGSIARFPMPENTGFSAKPSPVILVSGIEALPSSGGPAPSFVHSRI